MRLIDANPAPERMQTLPRGHNAPPPEVVKRNQRERLMTALALVLLERGYAGTTLSLVSARASVSKSDFYKHFETKDDCFLAAFEDAVEKMRESTLTSCAATGDGALPDDGDAAFKEKWAVGVVGSLSSLLTYLASEPAQARLVLVEGLCAGRLIYDRYLETIQDFASLLRESAPKGTEDTVPARIHEAAVGGIVALLTARVQTGETESIGELLPAIAEFALSPYLGATEARRILSAMSQSNGGI